MAVSDLLSNLIREADHLRMQLVGIEGAISALGGTTGAGIRRRGLKPGRPSGGIRRRRRLSARARKAISDAQKKRWAAQRAAAKK